MLKVRASAIGSNEYLKFEEIIRDESSIHNDEKLEKRYLGFLRVSRLTYLSELITRANE